MANVFGLLKMALSPTPGWIEKVRSGGQSAVATVLADPAAVADMNRMGGYKGKDGWIDVNVRVKAVSEPPFDAVMKCRLSEAMFGMMTAGMDVNVRYDPADTQHVVLTDDANTLLQKRVVP
jgi:hypothetical protein